MAVTLGDAIVFLRGDDKGLDESLGKAEKKTRGWASGLGGTVTKLVGGAIVGGAAAATGAILGIGVAAFNVAGDVSQATREIQGELGVTAEEAERFGDVAVEVFRDNFGGSVIEAKDAVVETSRQLGLLADDPALGRITEKALSIAETFDQDLNGVLNAAGTLSEQMGISFDEAMDFIAGGFQKGLDSSGDFLDTITEYSNLFGQAGADAGQFFSLMETGMQGGVLGTDKAADAFKEFQIRFLEGGDEMQGAIADLSGDSWGMFMDEIRSGDETVAHMAEKVIKWLGDIEDPIERNRIGVALFGTQFEDLGADAVLGIDMAKTSMEDLAGATEGLGARYESLGGFMEGLKRRAITALIPIGEKLLELANSAMPTVEKAFAWFEEKIPVVLGDIITLIETKVIPIVGGLAEAGDMLFDAVSWIFTGRGSEVDWWGDIVGTILSLFGMEITPDNELYNTLTALLWDVGEAATNAVTWVKENLLPALGTLASWFVTEGLPILGSFFGFIGENVLPLLGQFADWFIKEGLPVLVDFGQKVLIEVVIPAVEQLAIWARDIAEVVFPILAEAIGFVIENFKIIGPILGVVAGLILALTNPIVLVVAAIVGLAALWKKDWLGIRTFLTDTWKKHLQPIFKVLIDWLSKNIPKAIDALSKFWTDTLEPAIKVVWTFIKDYLFPIFTTLVNFWFAAIRAGLDAVATVWRTVLKPAIEFVWSFIKDYLFPIFDTLINFWFAGMRAELQFVATVWRTVLKPAIEFVWSFIKDYLFPLFDTLINVWFAGIRAAIDSLANVWRNVLKPAIELVWSFIKDSLFPVLSDLVSVYFEGIKSAINSVAGVWRDVLKPAFEGISSLINDTVLPALSSLSTFVSDTLGVAWSGLASTLNDTVGVAFSGLKTLIVDTIQPALDSFKTSVIDPLAWAFDAVSVAISTVMDWFNALKDAIANFELPDWMQPGSPMPLGLAFEHLAGAIEEAARNLPELEVGMRGIVGDVVGGGQERREVHNHYYLSMETEKSLGNVKWDFDMMQALAG